MSERARFALVAMMVLLVSTACGGGSEAVAEPSPVTPAGEPSMVTLALRFVEGEEEGALHEDDGSATPTTRVLLVDIDEARGRRTTDLGTYAGVCSHLARRPEMLLSAQCFWAAEGARIEVRRDGDLLVATRIALDAEQNEGVHTEVARIDLPPAAELDLLAPTTRLGATRKPTSSE